MPTRRQAIIWTNDGYFSDAYMPHSASMFNFQLYCHPSDFDCNWVIFRFRFGYLLLSPVHFVAVQVLSYIPFIWSIAISQSASIIFILIYNQATCHEDVLWFSNIIHYCIGMPLLLMMLPSLSPIVILDMFFILCDHTLYSFCRLIWGDNECGL